MNISKTSQSITSVTCVITITQWKMYVSDFSLKVAETDSDDERDNHRESKSTKKAFTLISSPRPSFAISATERAGAKR